MKETLHFLTECRYNSNYDIVTIICIVTIEMQGYGLTLTNNSKGPLAKLGLLEECIRLDCPSLCHWVFTPTGNIIGYYGRAFKNDSKTNRENSQVIDSSNGTTVNSSANPSAELSAASTSVSRGNLRIPRQDLRQMLLNRLDKNKVVIY